MLRVFTSLLILVLLVCSTAAWAQTGANPCDVNKDSKVDVADVQQVTNMYLAMLPCAVNIAGDAVCTTEVRQRVIAAAMGGTCVTGGPGSVVAHSATLSWTPSSGATGYNIYRSAVTGGPYTKVNASAIGGTSFTDTSVLAGQTYYYVATALNGSGESSYSNEARALVPSP